MGPSPAGPLAFCLVSLTGNKALPLGQADAPWVLPTATGLHPEHLFLHLQGRNKPHPSSCLSNCALVFCSSSLFFWDRLLPCACLACPLRRVSLRALSECTGQAVKGRSLNLQAGRDELTQPMTPGAGGVGMHQQASCGEEEACIPNDTNMHGQTHTLGDPAM